MSLVEMKIMVILSILQAKNSSKSILVLLKIVQNSPICSLSEFLLIKKWDFFTQKLCQFWKDCLDLEHCTTSSQVTLGLYLIQEYRENRRKQQMQSWNRKGIKITSFTESMPSFLAWYTRLLCLHVTSFEKNQPKNRQLSIGFSNVFSFVTC